jgi:hypothetical protein
MKEQNEFEITKEIDDLFLRAVAMRELRDGILENEFANIFFEKRAIKYAQECVELTTHAWREFHALYPELPQMRRSHG